MTDETPQFATPVVLSFSIKSEASGNGRVYWSTYGGQGMNEQTAVPFEIIHDGEFHRYDVTLPADKALREIRIDPATGPGLITLKDVSLATAAGYPLRKWSFLAD